MNQATQQGGQEQRLTFRLLSYWNRIRGSRSMPSLKDINVSEIEEIWHFSFIINSTEHDNHKMHFFGPDLISVFGQDYSGEAMKEALQEPILGNTIGFYYKVLEAKEPALEAASFFNDGNEVRYRSIIVPLSDDGHNVNFLMGTTNYKVFTNN